MALDSRLPAGFTSEAFEVFGVDPKPVQLALLEHWRVLSLLAYILQLGLGVIISYATYRFPTVVVSSSTLWLAVRGYFKLMHWSGFVRQDLGEGLVSWLGLMQNIRVLRTVTMLNKRFSPRGNELWHIFWILYLCLTVDRRRFPRNYLATWRKKHPNHVLTLFINNGSRIDIPCPEPADIDDEVILKHVKHFYYLDLFQGAVIHALIPQTLSSVEIVELVRGQVAGRPVETLDLGFDGHREVSYFEHPSGLKGSKAIAQQLRRQGVYRCVKHDCDCGDRANSLEAQGNTVRCLNMVPGWNGNATSTIILAPTILSIAISVAWPAVAVKVYGEDVQTSVQTGSTVASYVVTAGALLIALVAWYNQVSTAKSSGG